MTDRTLPISAPCSKKQGCFRSWRRSLETEYNMELCAALEPIIHLHIVSLVTHGEMFDMLYLGRWITGKVCQGHHIFRDESQWVAFSPATGSRERRTEDGRIKEERLVAARARDQRRPHGLFNSMRWYNVNKEKRDSWNWICQIICIRIRFIQWVSEWGVGSQDVLIYASKWYKLNRSCYIYYLLEKCLQKSLRVELRNNFFFWSQEKDIYKLRSAIQNQTFPHHEHGHGHITSMILVHYLYRILFSRVLAQP